MTHPQKAAAAARAAFDRYAGMDAPDLPTDEVPALQVRLFRWERGQFGYQPPGRYVHGIVEELQELVDAVRFDEVFDAVGDTLVFCAQLCTSYRLDLWTLWGASFDDLPLPPSHHIGFIRAVGFLARAELKSSQRIRGYDADRTREVTADGLMELFRSIRMFCFGIDPMKALQETAEKVMLRDWRRDALTGGAA